MQRCFSGGQLLFWRMLPLGSKEKEKGGREKIKKKKSYAFILKRLQSLMGLVKDIINYPNSRKDNANATNTASYQVLWGHLRALEAGDITRFFRAIPLFSSASPLVLPSSWKKSWSLWYSTWVQQTQMSCSLFGRIWLLCHCMLLFRDYVASWNLSLTRGPEGTELRGLMDAEEKEDVTWRLMPWEPGGVFPLGKAVLPSQLLEGSHSRLLLISPIS